MKKSPCLQDLSRRLELRMAIFKMLPMSWRLEILKKRKGKSNWKIEGENK